MTKVVSLFSLLAFAGCVTKSKQNLKSTNAPSSVEANLYDCIGDEIVVKYRVTGITGKPSLNINDTKTGVSNHAMGNAINTVVTDKSREVSTVLNAPETEIKATLLLSRIFLTIGETEHFEAAILYATSGENAKGESRDLKCQAKYVQF